MKGGKEVGGGGEASTATGIERSSLPLRSARLPYPAGGSPHGRIERRRDVDTQEVVVGGTAGEVSVRKVVPTLTSRKRQGLSLDGRC
jgi:hypothetical protein